MIFTCRGSFLLVLSVALASGGCGLIGGPRNTANIDLRKENQALRDKVDDLERQAVADAAMIQSHQEKVGTVPTLPRERLATLFTTHGIRLGKLTGAADLDSRQRGDEGLKVYVTPSDGAGDRLKAAGSFTVEAFDLSRDDGAKIGTWTFDLEAARKAWSSVFTRYEYVLTCPWQTPPAGGSLHVVVTFVDELTQGTFRKSVDVTVEPPASTTAPVTERTPAAEAPGR